MLLFYTHLKHTFVLLFYRWYLKTHVVLQRLVPKSPYILSFWMKGDPLLQQEKKIPSDFAKVGEVEQ